MAVAGLAFSHSQLLGPGTITNRSCSPRSFWCSRRGYLKVLALRKEKAPAPVPVLVAKSIEVIYDTLADRLLQSVERAPDLPDSAPYIVGLAGPPGAGKSTLASEVVYRLNTKASKPVNYVVEEVGGIGIAVPMDGFHLYRSQLDAMEDPAEAHARRGAPWTFNPALLLNCLRSLRIEGAASFPSFDHGVGDPVENDILVGKHHRVVVVEGNYLLVEDGIWKEVSEVFDEKWFIDVDLDIAMRRVLKRHVATGKEPDVAKWRIDYNDRPNAELIMKSKKNADLVIKSVDIASS